MADFLNEQEQVDVLKSWWKNNGKSIVFGVVLAVGIIGGWHFYQHRKAQITNAASVSYQALLNAEQKQNMSAVNAQAKLIKKEFPSTPYAVFSALFLAKEAVNQNHLSAARSQLLWAKKKANADLYPLIDLRLARVYNALKEPTEALKLLSDMPKGYEGSYYLARAEAYAIQGKTQRARLAYTRAGKSGIKDTNLLALVQMKLNSLKAS